MIAKNYSYFLKENFGEFKGKWVAISGDEIVSSGLNPAHVLQRAIKKGFKRPLLAKIPDKETNLY